MLERIQESAALQSIFLSNNNTLARKMGLLFLGVIALAIASQLSVPFKPVPLTFQSTTVVFLSMAFGRRLGTAVVITYLLAGICGLPFFADFSSGLARLYSPTGGYLIGFIPAAYISGYLAQRGFARGVVSSLCVASLGVSMIFLCGVIVLAQLIGWQQAFLLGFMPFVFSEIVKVLAVSVFVPRLWK